MEDARCALGESNRRIDLPDEAVDMQFGNGSGKFPKNRYAILPRIVSRKVRRGRSKRQIRKAEISVQRRVLEAAACLMACKARVDKKMDNNVNTDENSGTFCFDESIFSYYSNEEIERLLIGPGRKRQIRRVRRQRETGLSRRGGLHLERKANQFFKRSTFGRSFTHWKDNTAGRAFHLKSELYKKSIVFTHLVRYHPQPEA
jgi:hypothetical protein